MTAFWTWTAIILILGFWAWICIDNGPEADQ